MKKKHAPLPIPIYGRSPILHDPIWYHDLFPHPTIPDFPSICISPHLRTNPTKRKRKEKVKKILKKKMERAKK